MELALIIVCVITWYSVGLILSYMGFRRLRRRFATLKFNEPFYFIMAVFGPMNVAALTV